MTGAFSSVAQLMLNAGMTLDDARRQVDLAIIREALARCRGNQCRAADLLQIHRNTLSRRIHELRAKGFTIEVKKPPRSAYREGLRRQRRA